MKKANNPSPHNKAQASSSLNNAQASSSDAVSTAIAPTAPAPLCDQSHNPRRGRPRKTNPERHICYAIDLDTPEEVTILTIGAPFQWMIEVMDFLSHVAKEKELHRHHPPVHRNAHHTELLTLTLRQWDQRFCSQQDLIILLEASLKAVAKRATAPLKINKMTTERLVNL